MRTYETFQNWSDFNSQCTIDNLNIPVRCYFDKDKKTFHVYIAHPRKNHISSVMVFNVTLDECQKWVEEFRPELLVVETL